MSTKETTDRKPQEIDPSSVQQQYDGLCWSEYFVTLPPGMILQDLNEPAVWKQVQGFGSGRAGLRPLDRLTIIDFEMTWMVEARVCAATSNGASLAIVKKIDLPARNMNLPEIEDYRIAYSGRAYVVVSKRTGLGFGPHYISLAEATRALYARAPKLSA